MKIYFFFLLFFFFLLLFGQKKEKKKFFFEISFQSKCWFLIFFFEFDDWNKTNSDKLSVLKKIKLLK